VIGDEPINTGKCRSSERGSEIAGGDTATTGARTGFMMASPRSLEPVDGGPLLVYRSDTTTLEHFPEKWT
jgi:hypothetical protein